MEHLLSILILFELVHNRERFGGVLLQQVNRIGRYGQCQTGRDRTQESKCL